MSPKKSSAKIEKKYDLKRTPVVAVLGHVDHGKTSLLDVIRGTNVQAGEAGGITQNVRAHHVDWKGHKVTFIDTPGHEAFTAMRARGASVTDIVLLVIAADDGIQPQTRESIKYAKEGKIPMVVAINKTDLPGVDPMKIERELLKENIQTEDLGGDVLTVKTSAKEKKGIDEVMDAIFLTAEIAELKPIEPKDGEAEGIVLESALKKSLGPISLVLVKSGQVKNRDYVAWEGSSSRIRGMKNEFFKDIEEGNQSDPIWILGLDSVLDTGVKLKFYEMPVTKTELKNIENEEVVEEEEISLASLLGNTNDDVKKLNVILKADVKGTLEVVQDELNKLSDDEVKVSVIEGSTGEITEKDITKAKDSRGIVIGFRVGMDDETKKIAKREKVIVMTYEIIYELIQDVESALSGMLEPTEEEVEISRARVKKVFKLTDGSIVGGCIVEKGLVLKGYKVYVLRGDKRIGDSKIKSLRHGKEEIKEATIKTECGILLDPQIELEAKDIIVCFKVEKV